MLHDGIKTIQYGPFLFSLKKEQNLVSFQKTQKMGFKKHGGLFFSKKTRVFHNPAFLTFSISDLYYWPACENRCWVQLFHIICKVSQPELNVAAVMARSAFLKYRVPNIEQMNVPKQFTLWKAKQQL